MHVIRLHVERSSRPGVGFTDATNLLFKKRGHLAHKNLLAVCGAPDKVIGQLTGNVFGVR